MITVIIFSFSAALQALDIVLFWILAGYTDFAKHFLAIHTEMLWKLNRNLTMGSLSPPTTCLTPPSLRERLRMVLLSLSAMNRQLHGSSGAEVRPDGCARPALWGYALFLFSSFPLPAKRTHSPVLYSLQSHNEEKKRLAMMICYSACTKMNFFHFWKIQRIYAKCKSLHTLRIT